MHPAPSVIALTVASGAGYGLLASLGLLVALATVPPSVGLALGGFGLALALITAGLAASIPRLGHPGQAWRAFGQWRSSWPSREAVAAVATVAVAVPLAALVLAGDGGGASVERRLFFAEAKPTAMLYDGLPAA